MIFEPLDFIARLVTLVPRPKVNLNRYHGAFAPHSKYRALVTPAQRGTGKKAKATQQPPDPTPAERRAWPRPASRPVPGLTFSMTWAQRLKRVFNIDIETCSECGGAVKIIASIEDPAVIKQILAHLAEKAATAQLPPCRAPPVTGLFD